MSSLPKLAIVGLVVIVIGAVQFAVPALTNKQAATPILNALGSANMQANSALINHPISDYQNAQSGTLYVIHANTSL